MKKSSTNGTINLCNMIGALEIGSTFSSDDIALEAAAGPTPGMATRPRQFGGFCIGDDALEAAAQASTGPTQMNCTLPHVHCISDGALESSITAQPPTQPAPFCRHIDDGALEAAVIAGPYQTQRRPMGMCISDGDLETASASQPMTQHRPFGPCIADGELENMAAMQPSYPTQRRPMGFCITDSDLEAAVIAGPGPGPMTQRRPFGPCIADDALESAAVMGPPPTMPPFCHHIDEGAAVSHRA
jgi:hypothetical protein